MGLFDVIPQSRLDYENLTEVNKNFIKSTDSNYPINTIAIREYNTKRLELMEERSRRIIQNRITVSNMGFVMLVENGFEDIATSIYPNNVTLSVDKKRDQFFTMCEVIDTIISEQGYATRQQINNELLNIPGFSDWNIERVYKIYKSTLLEYFTYKRPSRIKKDRYGLETNKYIFERKNNNV